MQNVEKKLNILFLLPRFPYPVIGGDRLKPHNIIKYLASKHNVTLVTFFQGEKAPQSFVREVEKLGVDLHVIPLNPIKAGSKALTKLHKVYPLEIAYYYQQDYQQKVNELCRNKTFDLGFAFFMRTAEYIKNMDFPKILMAEDCRTLYQQRSYENSNNLKQRVVRWWEYRKLKRYEPEIVNHFNITTLVTKEDIVAMNSQNPNCDYRLLSNGTDINKFVPNSSGQRKGILFAGKLDVWANQLMIMKLVNDILPKIREHVPNAELHLVGATPPPSISNLANKYIKIFPDVPDMVPFLQNAELFLHPHEGGSGIQNKLLEAMACGCPVVTTPTGNQGINGEHGIHLLLGDNSDKLAEYAVKLLSDKEFAKDISQNGRNLIVETHAWEHIFQSVDNIIAEVLN
jgi:glycosyltransferase involved in cell wall biosynthesis